MFKKLLSLINFEVMFDLFDTQNCTGNKCMRKNKIGYFFQVENHCLMNVPEVSEQQLSKHSRAGRKGWRRTKRTEEQKKRYKSPFHAILVILRMVQQ